MMVTAARLVLTRIALLLLMMFPQSVPLLPATQWKLPMVRISPVVLATRVVTASHLFLIRLAMPFSKKSPVMPPQRHVNRPATALAPSIVNKVYVPKLVSVSPMRIATIPRINMPLFSVLVLWFAAPMVNVDDRAPTISVLPTSLLSNAWYHLVTSSPVLARRKCRAVSTTTVEVVTSWPSIRLGISCAIPSRENPRFVVPFLFRV